MSLFDEAFDASDEDVASQMGQRLIIGGVVVEDGVLTDVTREGDMVSGARIETASAQLHLTRKQEDEVKPVEGMLVQDGTGFVWKIIGKQNSGRGMSWSLANRGH